MKIKRNLIVCTLAGLLGGSFAQATLIATESFQTTADGAGGTYDDGSNFNAGINQDVVVGNSGFSDTKVWQHGTSALSPINDAGLSTGLSHNGLVNTAMSGTAILRPFQAGSNRRVARELASTPVTASSYYMSALFEGYTDTISGDKVATIGLIDGAGSSTVADFADGIHAGFARDVDTTYLSAWAGNTRYDLLEIDELNDDVTYQVLLQLDVDASGNEFFTAGYAANGASAFTFTHSAVDVGDIWSTSSDLGYLILQARARGTEQDIMGFADEFYFGTSMAEVTAIPEPSQFSMCIGFAVFYMLFSFRRGK